MDLEMLRQWPVAFRGWLRVEDRVRRGVDLLFIFAIVVDKLRFSDTEDNKEYESPLDEENFDEFVERAAIALKLEGDCPSLRSCELKRSASDDLIG